MQFTLEATMRTRTTFVQFLLFLFVIHLCTARSAWSQTTFGSITGTVTDPSGAVIPGARVTVTNEGTGGEREVITTGSGVFNVPNLNPGIYSVRVEATGFAVALGRELHLESNQVLDLPLQLTVGSTATTVEVAGAAPTIDTANSGLSNLKTSNDLENLPVVSRQYGDQGFYPYLAFNPGVNYSGNSLLNVQGVRQQTGVLPTMDGISVMAYPIGPGPVQPSLEAIQEVNVQINNSQAEFATATTFAVSTKPGTNEFHGGAFWDYNGNALNARSFFSSSVPFRVYNNFGGSIGGPIKKNKAFFYGDYEGGRESAVNTNVNNMPLVAWRTGDFSGLLPSTVIIDPLTGSPFLGNKIPQNRTSQVSLNIQNLYLVPNFGPPDLQFGNWRGATPGVTGFTNIDHFDVRVDYNFSPHDTVFVRESYRRLPLFYDCYWPPIGDINQLRSGQSGVLSWNHILSPALLNEFRTGYTRQRNFYEPFAIGTDIIKQVGIQGINVSTPIHNVPQFNFNGVTSLDMDAVCDNHNITLDTNFDWLDNLTWTRGKHFMKFGFNAIRDQRGGEFISSNIYGQYIFDGTFTGWDYADFLLGLPHITTTSVPTPPRYLRGTTWGFFAQDQFKLTSRLTLNYGLRWELEGPYYDKRGSIYSFDPANGMLVVPSVGLKQINPFFPTNIPVVSASQVTGFPDGPLVKYNKNGFYPRVGFAYKPFSDDKTVIRGGYGIYGNLIYGWVGQARTGGPFSGSATYVNQIVNGAPLFSFPQPFLPNVGSTVPPGTETVAGVNPQLKTPYTQQWNLTVERQVGTVGLRMSYLGSRSVQLVYTRNLNQPPASTIPFSNDRRPYPLYSTITWYDSGGNQSYNGLEIAAIKTYGKNLTFNAGWTWAKDLADTQEGAFAGPQIQDQFNRRAEKANNGITVTHRLYAYSIYRLPVGRGQRFLANSSRLTEGVLGGWNMAWIVAAQSGFFFTPSFSTFDPSNTNSFGGRPDRIGSGMLSSGQSISHWFDAGSFKVPGCPNTDPVCANPADIGRFGNSGINILRGPRNVNADLTLLKYFPLTEKLRMQFRAVFSNVFNHPHFGLPSTNISSPGTVTQIFGTDRPNIGAPEPRHIDLMLRFEF